MKYSTLKQIVQKRAHIIKENAAYSGEWGDGGSSNLLKKLGEFKNNLIVTYDLRPSESYMLNDIEVGEPQEFSSIIEDYKRGLAEEIIKNIKLS